MAKPRKIKVIHKKLRKDYALGTCDGKVVEIDIRLKGKKHLEILLHECIHFLWPAAEEDEVIEKSVRLTNTLWHEKYRRIDNDTSDELQDGKK